MLSVGVMSTLLAALVVVAVLSIWVPGLGVTAVTLCGLTALATTLAAITWYQRASYLRKKRNGDVMVREVSRGVDPPHTW